MAPPPEPEIQFAQRLASNEKPLRTRAVKKLRKYISARSQRANGGFTSEELLKLWKGLFYCLWMQDKPLLQEEISNQISGLLHNFQSVDGQFLYLEAFLQTVKREWTGIDRLRMDKFYQLVRFMFRQTLEMLKKKDWDSSVVSRFLETLTSQLLHSSSLAPMGLQLHVLDLYLTELTAVGAAELTAEQNLKFIEPFCKTAAKTKDQVLFKAMCGSIFSSIIDQAPFAIEDLMREVGDAGDSDLGQASDEEEEEEMKSDPVGKKMKKKGSGKQLNGTKSKGDDGEDDESDTELPDDEGAGSVLQFDYTAVADKLLELASRGNTPSQNRQRLYKIIKVLRDLSEGIFPQDEYPEEVSTDEDDDEMFGSRKRLRKRRPREDREGEEEEEEEEDDEGPAAKKKKKMKGKKAKDSESGQKTKDSRKDGNEPENCISDDGKKKKKKKKKRRKAGEGKSTAVEETAVATETQEESIGTDGKTPEPAEGPGAPTPPQEEDRADTAPPETPPSKKKRRKRNKSGAGLDAVTAAVKVTAAVRELQSPAAQNGDPSAGPAELEAPPAADADVGPPPTTTQNQPSPLAADSAKMTPPTRKTRKKGGKMAEMRSQAEEESSGAPAGDATETKAPESEVMPTTPAKKKKKVPKAESQVEEAEGAAVAQDAKTPTNKKNLQEVRSAQEEGTEDKMVAAAAPLKRKTKKASGTTQVADAETPPSQVAVDTPTQQKKNDNRDQEEAVTLEPGFECQPKGDAPAERQAPPSSQKKGKKRKIPVVFEFEADELEAAKVNGLAEDGEKKKMGNGVEAPSTSLRSSKKTPMKKKKKKDDEEPFISFQSNTAIPTPLFFKARGSPRTPLSSRKKPQTPMSESKKVTFGLKNNKTAEFKKTDRSLLVSPEGSSRVPFDPEQKPKFGVLKTPPGARKTPKSKKTPGKTPGTAIVTPRRRPAAADFF